MNRLLVEIQFPEKVSGGKCLIYDDGTYKCLTSDGDIVTFTGASHWFWKIENDIVVYSTNGDGGWNPFFNSEHIELEKMMARAINEALAEREIFSEEG